MKSLLERIDQVCEEFESAWLADGEPPNIEDHVGDWTEEERAELLRHLVPIDIHYRRRGGEEPDAASYRKRYPELEQQLGEESEGEVTSGKRFGEFVILREIGRGGMGVVYEAFQETLDRTVALKVLPSNLALSQNAVERFQREARAAGGLHHGNIVPVFEVGSVGSSFFIAMQRIDGESLEQLRRLLEGLSGSPLEQGEEGAGGLDFIDSAAQRLRHQWTNQRQEYYRSVARMGAQVADALAFAHGQGVIHRDIKPSNLLLDREGHIWVADFGLAKVADSDLTVTGDVVGTLRYLSPERLSGECDERGDVYGCGATLYELVTGRRVHAGSRRSTLVDSIERVEPTAPRALDTRVPRDLDTIILRAIDKDPANRYQDAAALGDDLRSFLEDRPIQARRVGLLERLVRWQRHNRAVALSLFGVFSLLLLLIIGATAAATLFSSQSRTNLELAIREGKARKAATASALKSRTTLYFAEMLLAGQAAEQDGGVGALRRFVDPWGEPDPTGHDPRGWEWNYLNGVAHQEARILEFSGGVWGVAWHPGKPLVAVARNPVTILDGGSGEVLQELPLPGWRINDVQWSPDGSFLAAGGVNLVTVWETETWTVHRTLPCQDQVGSVAWKPDGKQLAVQCFHDEFLRLWNVATNEVLASTEGRVALGGDVPQFTFSPKGDLIATGAGGRVFRVLDGDTLDSVRDYVDQPGVLYVAAFSQEGTLATSAVEPTIRLWEPRSGRELARLEGHSFRVTSVAWRGHELISGAWDYTIRHWDGSTGQELRQFKGHTRNIRRVDWEKNGTRLVSCGDDESVRFWNLEDPAPARTPRRGGKTHINEGTVAWSPGVGWILNIFGTGTLRDDEGRVLLQERDQRAIFSPEHGLLALHGPDGVRVQTWPEREPLGEFPLDTAYMTYGEFSPGGTHLAVSGPQGVTIADLTGPLATVEVPCTAIRDLEWSPSGDRLAIAHYENVKVVDPGGRVLQDRRYSSGVHGLAWGQAGTRLALACVDQTAKIVDVESLDVLQLFHGHANELRSVAWSPDGSRLATGSLDHSVRVWDVESGSLALILNMESSVLSVDWSAGGGRLIALGSYGRVQVWDATPGGF